MDIDKTLVEAFVAESLEYLQTFEEDIMAMERASTAKSGSPTGGEPPRTGGGIGAVQAVVDRAFRAVHTIKGNAGFLGFPQIQKLGHAMESLLSSIREGILPCTTDIANTSLKAVDRLRKMLTNPERSNKENVALEITLLETVRQSAHCSPASPQTVPLTEVHPDPAGGGRTEGLASNNLTAQTITTPRAEGLTSKTEQTETDDSAKTTNSIRIKVDILNNLVNLAGELVLTRNQLLQLHKSREGPFQELDRVTTSLQDTILRTRMQPIHNLLARFPRMVREVAQACNKQIELIIEGGDVELDRSILDGLSDPLMHLVRNAIDHGIEPPEERKRLGKPPTGQVSIKASHEGGQIHIDISDDGKGIDINRVREAAITRGLATSEKFEQMQPAEIMDLIFYPGFSTANKVTDLSGRGVGLDVVKSAIESLRGAVEIDTIPNEGTTFRLRVPLTLAIVPALLISLDNERFVIPQTGLVELVRVAEGDRDTRIERFKDSGALFRHGNLIPLVRLVDILGVPLIFVDEQQTQEIKPEHRIMIGDRRSVSGVPNETSERSETTLTTIEAPERREIPDRRANPQSPINVLILRVGTHQFGLIVDSVGEIQEIVIKPLPLHLKECRAYAGVTILADGTVAPILDPEGIFNQANFRVAEFEQESKKRQHKQTATDGNGRRKTILLFNCGTDELLGIALEQIDQIKRLAITEIQQAGQRRFIQYNDAALPVIELNNYLAISQPKYQNGTIYAIILSGQTPAAILATSLESLIETTTAEQVDQKIAGEIASILILNNRLTLLINPEALRATNQSVPNDFGTNKGQPPRGGPPRTGDGRQV